MDVGSSAETAVVVGTLWAEYAWLQEHHRDWTVVSHRECVEGERVFDILTLASPDGETREFYFDVSGCFRGRLPTPPCPYCGEPLVSAKAGQCGECITDFHDSAAVVHRKGRAFVEQARAMSAQRREREARPPGLKDPRAAFDAQFRPSQASPGVFVLRFPDRINAEDERFFRIGVECLIAEGCDAVVCDITQSVRRMRRPPTNEEWEQISLLLTRIIVFPRFGMRVVLVGGEELLRVVRVPILLENYDTEELAIVRLTAEMQSKDHSAV